ncbi:MAG: hypothetical protein JNK45_11800 [Myxococcales bacterium]|nr:hypothetical protein [Myxococcales bacterium]
MTWFLDRDFLAKLKAGGGPPACYEPTHVAAIVGVDVATVREFFAADRLYALHSVPDYGVFTGTFESRTALVCVGAPRSSTPAQDDVAPEPKGTPFEVVYFDERGASVGGERITVPDGESLDEVLEDFGFEDHPIRVHSFIHPAVELLALVPLPFHFHELLEDPDAIDPDERVELAAQLRRWIVDGCSVFHWGNAYFMARDGDVESS